MTPAPRPVSHLKLLVHSANIGGVDVTVVRNANGSHTAWTVGVGLELRDRHVYDAEGLDDSVTWGGEA